MSKLYPRLEDCRTRDIQGVLEWMLGEADACNDGIMPEQRRVFVALALMLDDELRFRNHRRKPLVPRPPACRRCGAYTTTEYCSRQCAGGRRP